MMEGEGLQLSVAVTAKGTIALHAPGSAVTITFEQLVIDGACASITVTLVDVLLALQAPAVTATL